MQAPHFPDNSPSETRKWNRTLIGTSSKYDWLERLRDSGCQSKTMATPFCPSGVWPRVLCGHTYPKGGTHRPSLVFSGIFPLLCWGVAILNSCRFVFWTTDPKTELAAIKEQQRARVLKTLPWGELWRKKYIYIYINDRQKFNSHVNNKKRSKHSLGVDRNEWDGSSSRVRDVRVKMNGTRFQKTYLGSAVQSQTNYERSKKQTKQATTSRKTKASILAQILYTIIFFTCFTTFNLANLVVFHFSIRRIFQKCRKGLLLST